MALPFKTSLDPIIPLAFAVQSGKGAYALLLGSGVSYAAEIKTGWQVLMDLIAKAAALSHADPGDDLETWYRLTFGEEPDYGRVLERLAPTPAERQALLRSYFEPTEEERERGTKTPTAAHRAIAQLVARGYIRVIVTTNFDRLLETALAEVSVQPYVVRSHVDVAGAPSMAQVSCLVVKVHGDYIDQRLKNAPSELAAYEPELDTLLDRILLDYGLVIAGWSAEWDGALRDAIARNPNRRFTTFWTARGSLSQRAKDLATNRNAQVITITDADTFFVRLDEMVSALEDMREHPPATAELAVSSAKRYLADPAGRIRLRDLLGRETEVVARVSADMYARPTDGGTFSELEFRLRRVDAAAASLCAIAATVGYWGDNDHVAGLVASIRDLGSFGDLVSGLTAFIELRRYPASLVLYGAGFGAVAANRYGSLATLSRASLLSQGERHPAAQQLTPGSVLDDAAIASYLAADGLPESRTPAAAWMRARVRQAAREIVRGDAEFERLYDRAECLLALAAGDQHGTGMWFPMGEHAPRGWRTERGVLVDLSEELAERGNDWPPVAEGFFSSTNRAKELIDAYREQVRTQRWF